MAQMNDKDPYSSLRCGSIERHLHVVSVVHVACAARSAAPVMRVHSAVVCVKSMRGFLGLRCGHVMTSSLEMPRINAPLSFPS
jgi:hypothetical protein